jgi:hypothetical protein
MCLEACEITSFLVSRVWWDLPRDIARVPVDKLTSSRFQDYPEPRLVSLVKKEEEKKPRGSDTRSERIKTRVSFMLQKKREEQGD